MTDVNEEIIEQYLATVKKWFYISDISFTVPSNYGNIDILAYDSKKKEYYDIEVKFRSAFTLPNNEESIDWLVGQFSKYKDEREEKIKEFCPGETTKILVATHQMLGKGEMKRKEMEQKFDNAMNKEGYKSEIWYFDEIIPELFKSVEEKGRHNTQLLQTMRMIKIYGTQPSTQTP